MHSHPEYKKRYYRAIDVKRKRNAKLKLDRRDIPYPEMCQRKGCQSRHHLILFTSYTQLKYLHLCEKHARRRIKRERTYGTNEGTREYKAQSGADWFDLGQEDAKNSISIDHHLYHPNYYKGYRFAFHGDEYGVFKIPWDNDNINLDVKSKKYW